MKKLDLNKIIIKSQNMLKEQAKSENMYIKIINRK